MKFFNIKSKSKLFIDIDDAFENLNSIIFKDKFFVKSILYIYLDQVSNFDLISIRVNFLYLSIWTLKYHILQSKELNVI